MFMKQERPEINDVLRKKKHLVVKKKFNILRKYSEKCF